MLETLGTLERDGGQSGPQFGLLSVVLKADVAGLGGYSERWGGKQGLGTAQVFPVEKGQRVGM